MQSWHLIKTGPQAAQIHLTGSLEAWRYCSCHGNSWPPLFCFLFEQLFGYLVRAEQTNQIPNFTKALFAHSDMTTPLQTMSCFMGSMKNTHSADQNRDVCYLFMMYYHLHTRDFRPVIIWKIWSTSSLFDFVLWGLMRKRRAYHSHHLIMNKGCNFQGSKHVFFTVQ